jgi:hypothetical protein
MTWGEFKAAVEQAGVEDDHVINYIDMDFNVIVEFNRSDDGVVFFHVSDF